MFFETQGANLRKGDQIMIKLLTATAAAALLASAANAAITVTSTPGPTPGQTLVETFDAPAAAGFTFSPTTAGTSTMSGIFTSSTPFVDAAPTGDTTAFFAGLGAPGTDGVVGTLTSATPLTSVSVEIGSLDTFNTVSFYNGSTLVEALTGSAISPLAGTSTTAYYAFTDTSGTFTSVTFGSSPHNAIEIDNIGISAAPEPSTWAMMFAGVAMVGAALRLGRHRQGAFAQA